MDNERGVIDSTKYINPESKLGWLAPDGTWYPCRRCDHRNVAQSILYKTERQLETSGYVKLYMNCFNEIEFYCEYGLTPQQYEFLAGRGYDKEELRIWGIWEPIRQEEQDGESRSD